MNRIAILSCDDRRLMIQEAAQRLGLLPVIVEKDFWVCWILGLIFSDDHLAQGLVFKGGTALSKVYGVIRRFSEDIDLSVSPSILNISEAEIDNASRRQRDNFMESLENACSQWAHTHLAPRIESKIQAVLGEPQPGQWAQFQKDESTHSPILLFHYPSILPEKAGYITPFVKLELGSLTDQQPVGRYAVRPWLADVLPAPLTKMQCQVVALDIARAFWEKATILHAEYHRDPATPMPSRYSRHYSDIAALAKHSAIEALIKDASLRQRVVDWKNRFFARA